MFYGTHFIMSPPTKSKLKRQGQLLSSMLSRTLSHKYRDLDPSFSGLGATDDPAELSTQLSAPGVLKVFGDSVCTGTHYKSVLATGASSAQELVKEALERYALDPESASQYVLCDVVGQAGGPGQRWQAQCFRVFGDNEKPLLIQELWKPREGLSRRFELRKRSDVEELAAKDVDTITAGENQRTGREAGATEPISWASFPMADLAPDLQHILFWMSNSIELLYFTQQACPLYMQSMEDELDVTGSKESLFSCALTASEEAMAVLEEVVLYAFQQCVYYLSKCLYVCLPALLECPPFQTEPRESCGSAPALPEELRRVVSVYQAALDLLRQLQVHPEVASQMLAYLFFFSGTLLLNQVLDRGPSLSCFHWPRGVQACARLQQLLEWTRSAGLGAAGERFFRKLSCTLHLLATPSAQLIQMSWAGLRAAFPALSPAQLHRLLTQYQLASAMGPLSAWEPGPQDSPEAFQLGEQGEGLGGCQPGPGPLPLGFCLHLGLWTCKEGSALLQIQAEAEGLPLLGAPAASAAGRGLAAQACAAHRCASVPTCVGAVWPHACAKSRGVPPLVWMQHTGRQGLGEVGPASLLPAIPSRLWPAVPLCVCVCACERRGGGCCDTCGDTAQAVGAPGSGSGRAAGLRVELLDGESRRQGPAPALGGPEGAGLLLPPPPEDVLESYEHPPPIVLPSEGFQVDLDAECLDDSIYQHLLYIRHFLWGLRSQAGSSGSATRPAHGEGVHPITERHPGGQGGALEAAPISSLSSGAPKVQGPLGRQPSHRGRGGPQPGPLQADPSCLLTPPSTPLGLESRDPDWPEPGIPCGKALPAGQRNGLASPPGTAAEGDSVAPVDEPPLAPSSGSSSTDDFCYVFMVELERGPSGLGMGLIDGMHTPLGAPGLYIQTLLPGSAAAADGRLSLGDRILEVDGHSLMGVSYLRAVDLIRRGGKKMRFLVAKSDMETARKIRFRTPPP
nr:ras-associating and dilute domain-containing protein isoform X3 [Oryctolagus cuniculus]